MEWTHLRKSVAGGSSMLLVLVLFLLISCSGGGDDNTPPVVVKPVKVSGVPTFGGLRLTNAFAWAPDSSRLAYIARQSSNSEELYSSTPDGKVNDTVAPVPLPSGGNVFSFLWLIRPP